MVSNLGGSPQFATATSYVDSAGVPIGDFDCDGRTDLAPRDRWTGQFSVYSNRYGSFATTSEGGGSTCGGPDCDVLVGDFNGDCFADYADFSWSQATFWVHSNNANPSQIGFSGWGQNWATVSVSCAANHRQCELLVGDFDGDSWDEYAEHDQSSGGICVFLNNHNGTFGVSGAANYCYVLPTNNVGPDYDVLTGDFNRDRITDLGVHHRVDTGSGRSRLTVFAGRSFFPTSATANPCVGRDCRVLGAPYE